MAYRMHTVGLAALAALIASPLAADVKRGVDAWGAGDYDTAVNEWRLPAQNGNADALFNMAQAYRLGRGVEADITRARQLYAEAAQKGHVKAADNYGLLLFQQGERAEAMPLIRAAAERGDPRAQYVLGLAHFNADYAEKDWVRAYALLTLAQSSGLPQAGGAMAQMDQYIPLEQRQKAQLLARDIETEAGKRRSAELAAVELAKADNAPAAPAAEVPAPRPTPTPVQVAQAPQPVSAAPAPAPAPVPVPVTASASTAPIALSGAWSVQLGAFGVPGNADRLWNQLEGNPALSGTRKALVPAGSVTRLRAVGYASQTDAARACSRLKAQGQACMVIKTSAEVLAKL
ncbi:MAG: SPOR domain-containing protein [Pseudomonadota bacterium]